MRVPGAVPCTFEAMATVKPVVVADATALPHLVHPGRNGYLLGDPAARRSLAEVSAHRASPATADTVRWPHSKPSASMAPLPPSRRP